MAFVGATVGREPFIFNGTSSPVGVVTPIGIGDIFVDTATPAYYYAKGLTSADWVSLGAGGVDTSAYTAYTPEYGFATTPATAWTHTTQLGRWKAHGKMVHAIFDCAGTLTTKGPADGYFYVTLPGTARNSVQGPSIVGNKSADFIVPPDTLWLGAQPVGNAARCSIIANKSGAIQEAVDAGDFVEGDAYRFSASVMFELA